MKRAVAQKGFTIVELLIVIVVIGILAAITIVAYNGIQQRARDSQRKTDIVALTKALELYYIDKGEYPPTSWACANGNNGWVSTADKDGCWKNFMTALAPYTQNATIFDPIGTQGVTGSALIYSPNYVITTYYCARQTYWLMYNTEQTIPNAVTDGSAGGCAALPSGSYPQSTTHQVIMKSKI